METYILNYRIIVEADQRTGTSKAGFSVYCPTLGLADGGDTIEEAIENIKSLIKFHVQCLAKDGKKIPIDKEEEIIATAKIKIRSKFPFSFA